MVTLAAGHHASARPTRAAATPRTPSSPGGAPVAAAIAGIAWFTVFGACALAFMHCWGHGFAPMPLSFGRGPLALIAMIGMSLSFATFGALLANHLPRNPIGWLLVGIGGLLALVPVTNALVESSMEVLEPAPRLTQLLAWLASSAVTPGVVTMLAAVLLVFPTGHVLAGRWVAGLLMAGAGGVALALSTGLTPEGLVWYPAMPNPVGMDASAAGMLSLLRMTGLALLIGSMAAATASLVVRYRTCGAEVRRQLRWMLASVVLTGGTVLPFVLARYVLGADDRTGELLLVAAGAIASTFPATAAIAISRYRLTEVELIISRTLVVVPLMAILGGMYSAFILLFQRLFIAFTGNTSDLAAVMTALVVASAFTPVRRTLEGVVERRYGTRTPARSGAVDEQALLDAERLARHLRELESRLGQLEHRRTRGRPGGMPQASMSARRPSAKPARSPNVAIPRTSSSLSGPTTRAIRRTEPPSASPIS